MTDYTREILCDIRKEVVVGSQGYINDPEALSEKRQKEMWLKAFAFEIEVNLGTENNPDLKYHFAQAAMLRSTKIRASDPHQGSRYEVYPVTAKHNMAYKEGKGKPTEGGIKVKYINGRKQRIHFNDIGVRDSPPESREYVNLLYDGQPALELPLGIDVAYGDIINNIENDFTRSLVSFDVVRHDFMLEEEQKIGIVVWRKGRIYEDDEVDPYEIEGEVKQSRKDRLSEDQEKKFYGPSGQAVILTGQITALYEGGKIFQHNINSYPGCSGAVIFLLDQNQNDSVKDGDYGCVIGVHAGGKPDEKFNVGMAIYEDFWKMARPKDYALLTEE